MSDVGKFYGEGVGRRKGNMGWGQVVVVFYHNLFFAVLGIELSLVYAR
jgi:hypothetical protein